MIVRCQEKLTSHELLCRLPPRGWRIEIGVHHVDSETGGPVTFRAERFGGDGAFFDAYSYEAAVRWLVETFRPDLLSVTP